ncbi:MAG: DUF3322 domain-containing protein, partial [Endomicrobium sp.]|nr:DUF3322 domain-containing protein [Endomicrobium sp.]
MSIKMKTKDDVRHDLARYFNNNYPKWLMALALKQNLENFPLSINLKPPTSKDALNNTQEVKKWIDSWGSLTPEYGIIKWTNVHWRYLGQQNIPEALVLHCPKVVARWLKQEALWDEAISRYQDAVTIFPEIMENLSRCYKELFTLTGSDFLRLINVLKWFKDNPFSNLYPREIPISGIDSKWLSAHTKSILTLAKTIFDTKIDQTNFYQKLGLKTPPALLRMRPLDSNLRQSLGGWHYIAVPFQDLATLKINPRLVIIVENLQTGLAMKDLPGAI